MASLKALPPEVEGQEAAPVKTFKDYGPGFVHVDIEYLSQMPDETSRRYLFVTIDRATRWGTCAPTAIRASATATTSCALLGIEQRLCPPRHPQTNGLVERFNGRIADLVEQTRFASAAEIETTWQHDRVTYNHCIAQRALKHQSPLQTLKGWRHKKPQLFVKRVYEQAELDSQLCSELLKRCHSSAK